MKTSTLSHCSSSHCDSVCQRGFVSLAGTSRIDDAYWKLGNFVGRSSRVIILFTLKKVGS